MQHVGFSLHLVGSLWYMDSLVMLHRLSCSATYGILVPCPQIGTGSLALQSEFLTIGPSGKSHFHSMSIIHLFNTLLVSTLSMKDTKMKKREILLCMSQRLEMLQISESRKSFGHMKKMKEDTAFVSYCCYNK